MKKVLVSFILLAMCLGAAIGFGLSYAVHAAESEVTPFVPDDEHIEIQAYKLEDNSGYYETANKRVTKDGHPLKNSLINLSVYANGDSAQAKIDTGKVSNFTGYGITGNYVSIQLGYNFKNPEYMIGENEHAYSISNDTYQSVGDFKDVGVVGTGAILFQKKTDPNGPWEWQTKDGETKNQLHTFNFTDTVKLADYAYNEKYTLYTPAGEDLSKGVFIKISFAYEIKRTVTWVEKNFFGRWVEKSETYYTNMLEVAEFYLVQNSGQVLFHNASNFGKLGEEDESGALTVDKFETILSGDVTLNGFRLDTLGVDAYDISYRHNGGAECNAEDGQVFLNHGRYDFIIKRKIGEALPYTIFVDRRGINDAVAGYFGQSLFTADSQRVYTTGQYPAYLAGKATWNLNATDGTVAPLAGILYKVVGEGEDAEEVPVSEIAQPYGSDYRTRRLQGTVNEVGIYKAEFWGNPKYLGNGEISGDLYHFIFRFEIVDKDTHTNPSINETYLNGLNGFSDMQSKYYSIALQTSGTGKAIFAFADYGGAYDFAYKIERAKVEILNSQYKYKGISYTTQKEVLAAIDAEVASLVKIRYFDATNPESYQTADVGDKKITQLNFTKDVIVFSGDTEQDYAQAGLPSLNGRKYRYVSPDTGEIEEGILYFSFIEIAGFESQSIELTLKDTDTKYDISYSISVEYQLGIKNAPSGIYTVKETNAFGGFSEYDTVYIKPGDMTGSATVDVFRNGTFSEIKFNKNNTSTVTNASGFILKSVANTLDPYSIVKLTKDGKTSIYSFDEVSDLWFSEGGVYDFVLADRQGNTIAFTIIVSNAVGHAEINLELEFADETIPTHFRAFVGQEIELPTPVMSNELFVFDGWLYDDTLITNGKFTPTTSGTLHIWQQVTQKYTFINFDSKGGLPIDQLKVEIGKPITLPTTTKDGWRFGGWEYGGNVYNGSYTPTSASPTFSAVWNYQTTTIDLYDGNLYQSITAHAGDKVLLPFPTRTGYTFFGWKQENTDGTKKVYYGQITSLTNMPSLRLEALWIRDGSVTLDDLGSGTGGKTKIHFVDGELLSADSLQGVVGSTIATPNPTRAGFVLVGWVWRTSPIAGKLYTNGTMTIPTSSGNKIMLEALWAAKSTGGSQGGAGAGTLSPEGNNPNTPTAAPFSLSYGMKVGLFGILSVLLVLAVYFFNHARKKKGLVKIKKQPEPKPAPVKEKVISVRTIIAPPIKQTSTASTVGVVEQPYHSSNNRNNKSKWEGFSLNTKLGLLALLTTIALVVVMSITCAFGNWVNLGVFQAAESTATETTDQSTTLLDENIAGNFNVINSSPEPKPSKTEVMENFTSVDKQGMIKLSEDESILTSIVTMDLSGMGYTVFPAIAIKLDNTEVLGLGYTNYEEKLSVNEYASGFISLPRQNTISWDDALDYVNICKLDENGNKTQDPEFTLTFCENYNTKAQYVANNKYVTYAISDFQIVYDIVDDIGVYDETCGAVYNYDIERYVFDPDLGKNYEIKAESINTLLDPTIAKGEYNSYITQQTANGFSVDTMNFAYISYAAIEAYLLDKQDESLLGIDVEEFYAMERTVGPNEYYSVDADGNLTKFDLPPKDEDKAGWLDRLFGFVYAIGSICIGFVIVAAVTFVSCGVASAAAPYIMGAFIGSGVEVFMQTVVQGKKIEEINWLNVGIAAVSGALAAIPGLGYIGSGLLHGITEAAFTYMDGGSLEEMLGAFTTGFITGLVIKGAGKGLRNLKLCFTAGTAVLMANGLSKNIENVRMGDKVRSYNERLGRFENSYVTQTFVNETEELCKVTLSNGEVLSPTPNHRFRAEGQWISAKNLRAGDVLLTVNGQHVIVEQVQHEILELPIKVYNFSVSGNHNYLVSQNTLSSEFVSVHNKGCENVVTDRLKAIAKVGLGTLSSFGVLAGAEKILGMIGNISIPMPKDVAKMEVKERDKITFDLPPRKKPPNEKHFYELAFLNFGNGNMITTNFFFSIFQITVIILVMVGENAESEWYNIDVSDVSFIKSVIKAMKNYVSKNRFVAWGSWTNGGETKAKLLRDMLSNAASRVSDVAEGVAVPGKTQYRHHHAWFNNYKPPEKDTEITEFKAIRNNVHLWFGHRL